MNTPLDIILVANNTVNVTLNVIQQDGAPLDMTGYSAFWQVKQKDSITPLISKSTAESTITISTSTLSWQILDTDTVELQIENYTEYEHEMIVLDMSGNPITVTNNDPRISWGKLTVRKQITIPT